MPFINPIEQDIDTIDTKVFHLTYKLDRKTNSWQFVGYKCTMCHTTLKNPKVLDRHKSICRMYKVRKVKDLDDITILNVEGELWKPKDFNLK